MLFNHKLLNPLGFHLLKLTQDTDIRHIIMYGGSSSGKSYSCAQIFLLLTLWEGSNTLVMRKVGASIKDSIYQDFKTAADQMGVTCRFRFSDGVKTVTCLENGARIVFKGLDDSEKIKGLSSFKRVVMDEWSEFEETDYKQMRLRLRGMKGQQFVYTFNPIKETHWIKKKVFDTQKWHDVPMTVELNGQRIPERYTRVKSMRMNEPRTVPDRRTGEMVEHAPDTVVIQTTYLNNFWVVGSPDGTYGYYDEQCIANFEHDRIHDPDYYNVYALGEWGVIRTGSEFFGSFARGTHSGDVAYNPGLPIHLSVDNNVLPYISFTFWQADLSAGFRLTQFDELCAESPDNTVRRAAKLVAAKVKGYGADMVYLHGDASTRAANSIDDEKRSWLDLLIDALAKESVDVRDCVGTRNPPVAMSGEFINAIFEGEVEGVSILVGEECRVSIEDYMSVQKDVNGAILKLRFKNKATGQTYEEHGHLSDTFRYVVCDLLANEFTVFSNRRKRNLHACDGAIRFFNPDTQCAYSDELAYCMPNMEGKFILIHGRKCGEAWHIVHVRYMETVSTEGIKAALSECGSERIILECPKSYYMMARELQESVDADVRAIRLGTDLERRIAATSDFVRESVRFNGRLMDTEAEYGGFVAGLLDYRSDTGESIEASAALSGFIQAALKLGL